MSKRPAKTATSPGVLGTLRLEGLEALAGELKPWRTPELKELEQEKGSGLVLGFVKGLRLSARLIYILRTSLGSCGLKVDWGHLLDPSGCSCSPECDVIIHRGHVQQWNGNAAPVMDFKFVECDKAIAVISCKSYARDVDAAYPKKLKPYVRTVFLFSECCAPAALTRLRNKATRSGYRGFACLYTYDEATGECVNLPGEWDKFLSKILKVGTVATSGKK